MEGMLGGIIGLVGAGLQAQAQAAQIEYEYAALNWQKQRAAEQDRFAQAGREDMYGNLTAYDPVLNKWTVKLAPDQQTIRDATQKEQLTELTKDIPAARKVKEAIQQRAYEAKAPFHTAELGYQYDQPQSEAADRSELTRLMATNAQAQTKAQQALMMREALRMGRGDRTAGIINDADQALGNADVMNQRALTARSEAIKEYAAGLQEHEAKWGTPMKVWGDLMAQGGDMPNVSRGNLDQSLNSMINSQASAMNSAFNSGTSGVGGALNNLASAVGKYPDLSAAAKAFGSIGKQKAQNPDDTYNPANDMMGYSTFGKTNPMDANAMMWDDSGSSWDNRDFGGW